MEARLTMMSRRLPLGLFEATVTHRIEIPQLDQILGAIGAPSKEWQSKIEAILMAVKVDLNKLRRGLDKFHSNEAERKRLLAEKAEYLASEEVEDAEAAVYRAQSEEYKALSEAEKASLRVKIAELEAQGDGLTEAQRESLNGMIEELATAVALEPEAPTDPEVEEPDETETDPDTGNEPAPDAPSPDEPAPAPNPVITPAPSPL